MEVNCPRCKHLFETRLVNYPKSVEKNRVYGGWRTTEKTRMFRKKNQREVQVLCVCIKCKKEKWLGTSNILYKYSCRECYLNLQKGRGQRGFLHIKVQPKRRLKKIEPNSPGKCKIISS